MTKEHPNITLLSKLELRDLDASSGLFSKDFVWHYVNPNLPEFEGDYQGVEGLKNFFSSLAGKTKGTFDVEVVSTTPVGDEFVVVHVRDTMVLDDNPVEVDAVVVWRFVDDRIFEAWDIPSAFTLAK